MFYVYNFRTSDGIYEFTRVPPGTFSVAFDTLRPDRAAGGRSACLLAAGLRRARLSRGAPPTSLFFFGPPAVSDRHGDFALVVPGDAVYEVVVEMPNDLPRTPGLKLTARPSQGDRWIDIVIPPGKQGSGIGDRGSGIRDRGSGIGDRGSGIRDQGRRSDLRLACERANSHPMRIRSRSASGWIRDNRTSTQG